MNDIKVWMLISGEEIIGEFFNSFPDHIEVKTPAVILMQQTEKGIQMGMMPSMPYAEGNIKLYKHAIAKEATPSDKMINEYNRLYGSGIEIAPASALAGLQMP
jgi:hypothetical protein